MTRKYFPGEWYSIKYLDQIPMDAMIFIPKVDEPMKKSTYECGNDFFGNMNPLKSEIWSPVETITVKGDGV